MSKLLDVIMSGLAAEVDAAAHDVDHEDQQTCAAHKVPIEMYAFLLNWSARSADKVVNQVPDEDAPTPVPAKTRKGRGGKPTQPRAAAKNKASGWSWKDQIVPILTLISKVLKLKTSKIWTVSGEKDTFIGYVVCQDIVNGISHIAPRGMADVLLRLHITSRKTTST
jgi:condensin complex subunit 1